MSVSLAVPGVAEDRDGGGYLYLLNTIWFVIKIDLSSAIRVDFTDESNAKIATCFKSH